MLAYLADTKAIKRSAERDHYSAKRLYPVFTGRMLDSLTPADIRQYIRQRKSEDIQPATINKELRLLSSALNHAAREWGWVVSNPVSGRTFFIRLALHTGMRRGELLSLEWARVDFSANLIHLAGINTKSGKRRSIPLNATARAALINRAGFRASHCPNAPWVFCNAGGQRIASIKRSFNTACRRAGLVDFHIHDLRHTCAAWLISAGVALAEVRDLLGHASITMTERYAHLAPENVRAAVAVLDSASRSGHASKEEKEVKRG
ncbi:MAG: site-specific integrase [Candidatus Contendobacter sp.]|nr:site-specific integrase [Candidatus Contendobacter sp.]